MSRKGFVRGIFFPLAAIILAACGKDLAIQELESNDYPDYFPTPVYQKTFNAKEFELGRSLFYDPILSIDSSISCASCHGQMHAFADHNKALSVGVDGKIGRRNSPAMFNLIWQPHFMADGGITHLEIMPLAPLTDTLEMNNHSFAGLITKLNHNSTYISMFDEVYGKEVIDDQQLFFALAQFMAQMNSYQSKYDAVRQGKTEFTPLEAQGYELFKTHCNTCHTEPLFTNYSFQNNGLKEKYTDVGRFRVTQEEQDRHRFKVPSLRNIHLTRPYLHDGSIRDLRAAVEGYTQPYAHSNLAPQLKNGVPMNPQEIDALLQFLGTLNDYKFIANPKFAAP